MSQYKSLIKQLLARHTLTLRLRRQFTQERMSEELRISCRAYSDLERGKYCFSAITLLFFMSMLTPDELAALLNDFNITVEKIETTEAA